MGSKKTNFFLCYSELALIFSFFLLRGVAQIVTQGSDNVELLQILSWHTYLGTNS